ncbi:hypothetical protein [Halpernia sp. GG3]
MKWERAYKFRLPNEKQSFVVRANVYNLLNTYFIQNSYTNIQSSDKVSSAANAPTYDQSGLVYHGVATDNQVFFGFGRTFSVNVAYNF